jgi:hypothetical protein
MGGEGFDILGKPKITCIMRTNTQLFLQEFTKARTRFSNQLQFLSETDLRMKLPGSPNSVGFLLRHIGDVEFLFAKNVFGQKDISVSAKTVIAQKDTGEWIDKASLIAYVEESFSILSEIIAKQSEQDWEEEIETREFGRKTKAEALGRIISHTAIMPVKWH